MKDRLPGGAGKIVTGVLVECARRRYRAFGGAEPGNSSVPNRLPVSVIQTMGMPASHATAGP
jgi:hypothetical protein